jgi:hypothetical protein
MSLNNNKKLEYLIAPDLFASDLKQVFSAKTGKYLGVVKEGQQISIQEQAEAIEQPDKPNKAQLKLF